MLREAFDPDRYISAVSLNRWVIQFRVTASVLDLPTDDTLDAFRLDDQISTSRDPQVWDSAQHIGDLLWQRNRNRDRKPGITYRSRTTPQHNTNLAFFAATTRTIDTVTRLRDSPRLLEAAILSDGFTIEI